MGQMWQWNYWIITSTSEFLNEVVLMTGVKHKNLVKVNGCSLQCTQRLIVFEFVENKNLAEALWGMTFST
jgi:hypothetical protein